MQKIEPRLAPNSQDPSLYLLQHLLPSFLPKLYDALLGPVIFFSLSLFFIFFIFLSF